ncbi:fimbrial protein [Achromobacter seleniivolatilans]|uniref:Fimbrial protein n=1 Tax=Achromobacter seleniivolatilans TaxID=3047478 RepID=A0ABY9M2L4_9BURK|nr:fimbrial protein [Achromobacter sp. R39]WMD20809.1 fimbrial protein [Achromobacter sp. R39]
MKKALTVAFIAVGFISSSAFAADGQINITGEVTAASCVINGGMYNKTVTLPSVSTISMPSYGSTAGDTAFTIPLNNCSPSTINAALMHFEAGSTINVSTGNLKNQAFGGSNVEVQLLDGNTFSVLNLNGGAGAQGLAPVAVSMGSADVNLVARYIASGGPAMAGPVSTYVTFSMAYN